MSDDYHTFLRLQLSRCQPNSRDAIEHAIATVPECRVVSFMEYARGFAVEVEIQGPTMAAVRSAAALAKGQIAAGIAFSWIPAGEAARELEREAIGGEIDWRPTSTIPEDLYAF